MVDKLVGNKAAEESNASYTDAMKKQVEEQNKNRAISKGAFDSQVTAAKEKQKKGGRLSATEQAILKASSDKNVITRGDRINTVMNAINDAGDNLTKDDVNDAIDFIDVNLAQVEKEAVDSKKNASTTFQDLAKKTEFYATGLFYNESFKTLVNSPTLAATEQALKMIRAERFGMNLASANPIPGLDDDAKKAARAERFGIVTDADRMKARAERFGMK